MQFRIIYVYSFSPAADDDDVHKSRDSCFGISIEGFTKRAESSRTRRSKTTLSEAAPKKKLQHMTSLLCRKNEEVETCVHKESEKKVHSLVGYVSTSRAVIHENFRQFFCWWCKWTTFFGSLACYGRVLVVLRTLPNGLIFISFIPVWFRNSRKRIVYAIRQMLYKIRHLQYIFTLLCCLLFFLHFFPSKHGVVRPNTHQEFSLALYLLPKKYWNNKKSFGCSLNLNIWFTFDYSVFEHLGVNSALKIFYFNFSLNHTKV